MRGMLKADVIRRVGRGQPRGLQECRKPTERLDVASALGDFTFPPHDVRCRKSKEREKNTSRTHIESDLTDV
jgi:hypothetical protein